MTTALIDWKYCLDHLAQKIGEHELNLWIRPLQVDIDDQVLVLFAPNDFVMNHVNEHLLPSIVEVMHSIESLAALSVRVVKGSSPQRHVGKSTQSASLGRPINTSTPIIGASNINPHLTFEKFIPGKSNQLALAAAKQVAENPGIYNPLVFYADVGLGKTHLTQAIANEILTRRPHAKVLYVHAETFVTDMVKSLQRNTIDQFKAKYRASDLVILMVDDVQFFAGKERSQEEFFHTFNALLESKQQIVLTCDRYPKEVCVEERLKSRFGWGLSVGIETPELETRVAILMSKAEQSQIDLPNEVAFFIAQQVKSNVRELEGALKRVIASAHFTGSKITLEFTKEALKDLLAVQAKLVSVENIQKTVAEYYKIKLTELLSKRRHRSLARPRQMAMAIAKELTQHSLPEIGELFGGRDHTTVLHACKKIKELTDTNPSWLEDFKNLMRILSA